MLCDRVAEMSAIEDPQNKTELAKYEAALVKRAGAAGRYINGLPIDLEHKLKLRGDIRKLLEKKLRTTSDGMPKK